MDINNKWTYDICKKEALKYNTRMEFKNNCSTAYRKCIDNKWEVAFKHMKEILKPSGYWTYDKCKEEASKHKMRGDFSKATGWAYNTALMNGWLDDICTHMITVGNYKKRCIYAYEFPNNVVYIGLTYSFEHRWIKRLTDKKDIVNIYMKNNNDIQPKRIQLTDYIDKDEASKLEGEYLKLYKNNNWTILNRIKTGSIGGTSIIWHYDVCKEEALKYTTWVDFRNNKLGCLAAIYKNKWLELISHLEYTKIKWTYLKCKECAEKCENRTIFYKKYKGAYAKSYREKWLDIFYPKHLS